jgi:hypothetical protein
LKVYLEQLGMAIALRLATVTKGSMIIASGINNTSTSAPTPSNLMIVPCRRPNDGCDLGNGGALVDQPRCEIEHLLDFCPRIRQISVDFSKVLPCPPTIEICG